MKPWYVLYVFLNTHGENYLPKPPIDGELWQQRGSAQTGYAVLFYLGYLSWSAIPKSFRKQILRTDLALLVISAFYLPHNFKG